MTVQFRILGSLEVVVDGRPLALGGAKQRAVLADLLIHANQVVSSDRLIEDLWGERAPQNVPGTGLEAGNWQRRAAHGMDEIEEALDTPGVVLELSLIFLGENLSPARLLGAGLIVAGALLVSR